MGGEVIYGNPLARARGVSSDSRSVSAGNLFVPLRGPNFDGHNFIRETLIKGAAGSLVQRGFESTAPANGASTFLIRVEDTLRALGDLARFWRNRLPVTVIGITGSNGKTTTKEMTARILSGPFKVLQTEGNFNNLIGLPLMLLRLSPEHEIAVLEMGMNAPGEIARLREIAEPRISTITNIGRAHLEFLGDLDGVARAKGELWDKLTPEDCIAVNVDDARIVALAATAPSCRITFGMVQHADVHGENLRVEPGRGTSFSLSMNGKKKDVLLGVFGSHHVYNALAAAALASAAGAEWHEILGGLENFQPYHGRGEIIRLRGNVCILNDTYNSNPDSLRASLAAFAEMKGQRRGLVVLGDMLELGSASDQAHEEAGRAIVEMGFGRLYFVGEHAPEFARGANVRAVNGIRVQVARKPDELLETLEKAIEPGDWIFIKGSRRMRMEKIVAGLEQRLGRA